MKLSMLKNKIQWRANRLIENVRYKDELLVSVLCITYNHENYIRDALEGFVSQKTSFKYEVIVHDDASTDRTAEIVREYEAKYPDIVHGIYQVENQGSKGVRATPIAFGASKGKYIALCEGDDYWLDVNKLQTQVAFLEKHKDYIMTVHDGIRINCRDNTVEAMRPYTRDKRLTPEDIIMQYHGNVPTASIVCKREVLEMSGFFAEAGVSDWPWQLYALTKGNIYYFAKIMSAYRWFRPGSWSAGTLNKSNIHWKHCLRMMDFLVKYNDYTQKKHEKFIVSKLQFTYLQPVVFQYAKGAHISFIDECTRYDENTGEKYHYCLEEMKRIIRQAYDENYYSDKLETFVKGKEHLIILGTEAASEVLAAQLKNHGVEIDGFADWEIKDGQTQYMDKPLWQIENLPYAGRDVAVLVATTELLWSFVIFLMDAGGIEHYYNPFLFRL